MNLQDKIDSITQYEDYAAILCGVVIVVFIIISLTRKDKPTQKGGYSLLVLCVGAFAVMYFICNTGGGTV